MKVTTDFISVYKSKLIIAFKGNGIGQSFHALVEKAANHSRPKLNDEKF